MAIVLGVTGGIGSGKSYVCRIFESLGCCTYNSDLRTKELYDTDTGLVASLVEILGSGILENGRLDRKAMAAVIFSDRQKMEQVRSSVYPYVMEDFRKWKRWKRGVVLLESAVLLESELVRSYADKVLVVTAPLDLRISRVMERDGFTERQVRDRLANQIDDKERICRADYVIESVPGVDVVSRAKEILLDMGASPKTTEDLK